MASNHRCRQCLDSRFQIISLVQLAYTVAQEYWSYEREYQEQISNDRGSPEESR